MKHLILFENFENLETKQQIIEEIEKIQNKIKAQSFMASMRPSVNKLEMIRSWENKIKDLQDKLQLFENFMKHLNTFKLFERLDESTYKLFESLESEMNF